VIDWFVGLTLGCLSVGILLHWLADWITD